ncbi:GerW family sporulation protein [Caldalkalibacillus salinus]|uniref:GerW family sporulation protein n=1 Tax=Caldalkalibacillus salinus TaxID=2803787 RepID=UPI0019212415|nr:GerW family sporulation protein [Caldalkalibacillus salinus]
MAEHPIQGLMKTAMENLKEMVDVNTIVGDPVETPDGSVILPVSKVGFGFAAGGTDYNLEEDASSSGQELPGGGGEKESNHPFGGGSGGGVSITPVAFLVVNSHGIKMVHIDGQTHLYEKILDSAPQLFEKIQKMMSNKTQKSKINPEQKFKNDNVEF